MAAELIVAPEAEQDIAEAYAWYEDYRVGLAEDLLERIDACVQSILRSPEAHAIVHDNYRRALVRRFRYAVFLRIREQHRDCLLRLPYLAQP